VAINRLSTVNDIINQVAVEVGLNPASNVFASPDTAFEQLRYLLQSSLKELLELFPWQILTRSFSYTTVQGEVGKISLPSDFAYMIPQTGWDQNNNVPLVGPLSPQDWTYLRGRDLVGSTIYASFRLNENQLWIFPQNPMPADLQITFEYISLNLVQKAGVLPIEYTDQIEEAADIPLFPPHLIQRLLKAKYLEAKGFDSQKAQDAFWQSFNSWSGRDNSAPILNAGRAWRGYNYLNGFYNTPDSGFGRAV
jgi:hypothetical protein|tara:strand:- start:1723 stop:2475 length:753 start_codon:yes stop_codon:yes gene_type:complete